MQITIEVPDDIAHILEAKLSNLPRRSLELLAVEAYRTGAISAAEVRRMLGFTSRWETDAFLKQEEAYLPYTEADLESDVQAIRKIMAQE